MGRDQCIVSGEPAAPVIRTTAGAEAVLKAAAETVFLGLDDGRRRLSNEPASLWITQKKLSTGLNSRDRASASPARFTAWYKRSPRVTTPRHLT